MYCLNLLRYLYLKLIMRFKCQRFEINRINKKYRQIFFKLITVILPILALNRSRTVSVGYGQIRSNPVEPGTATVADKNRKNYCKESEIIMKLSLKV